MTDIPAQGKDLARYRAALLAAFDGRTFEMFYSDHEFGTLENDVSTEAGFDQVLFDVLDARKMDGTLAHLLVAALRFRGQNDELAATLAKPLGLEPVVALASELVALRCPAAVRDEALAKTIDAKLLESRGPRRTGERAQWIDTLVWIDALSTKADPIVLRFLEELATLWKATNASGAETVQRFVATQEKAFGIDSKKPSSDDGDRDPDPDGSGKTPPEKSPTLRADIPLPALARVLAKLYAQPADQRRVVLDAGLDETRIAFDASAINSWTSIVRYAKLRNALPRLVAIALDEFSENEDLQRVVRP